MRFHDKEIEALYRKGYQVEQLTPYQFRIECVLDLYPKRRRFHNIASQQRGEYPYFPMVKLQVLTDFVDRHVKTADDILDRAIADGQLDVVSAEDTNAQRRHWLGSNNPAWWSKYTKAGA